MSETKLNLSDAQLTISGTIHGSVADACIASLSAEPETITELEAALARYQKPTGDISPFVCFRKGHLDMEPYDAGIVIIDLAARIIASESTYSRPGHEGQVNYHDGVCATHISIPYRLPDDWLFLDSIDVYEGLRESRRQDRLSKPPLDARGVLYGRPLLEFIARESCQLNDEPAPAAGCVGSVEVERSIAVHAAEPAPSGPATQSKGCNSSAAAVGEVDHDQSDIPGEHDALRKQISLVHARWLMTPRDDLRGQSPRDVLLARQDFIDYDLHTRSMQWSLQGEGPLCLATDSFAYRYGGFGTHEWVIYYDLVRHLLWNAPKGSERTRHGETGSNKPEELESEIVRLEKLKTEWLEHPLQDYDGRIPALLIENERIRLPIAMRGHDMVIDDDCPVCQMMANDAELGMEVGFWHLDGAHMDDDFAFSELRTRGEWEAERREWEEFTEKFNREWEERQQRERLASVEPVEERMDSNKPVS